MGKTVGFTDAWAKHNERWRATEDRYDEIPKVSKLVPQDMGNGKTRWRFRDSAIGVEDTVHHYNGDRLNVLKEVPLGNGDIDVYWQRWGDDGSSRGTYVQRWNKIGEGTHRAEKARRITSYG